MHVYVYMHTCTHTITYTYRTTRMHDNSKLMYISCSYFCICVLYRVCVYIYIYIYIYISYIWCTSRSRMRLYYFFACNYHSQTHSYQACILCSTSLHFPPATSSLSSIIAAKAQMQSQRCDLNIDQTLSPCITDLVGLLVLSVLVLSVLVLSVLVFSVCSTSCCCACIHVCVYVYNVFFLLKIPIRVQFLFSVSLRMTESRISLQARTYLCESPKGTDVCTASHVA